MPEKKSSTQLAKPAPNLARFLYELKRLLETPYRRTSLFRDVFPDSPGRPVWTAMRNSFFEKMDRCCGIAGDYCAAREYCLSIKKPMPDIAERLFWKELLRPAQGFNELLGWIEPPTQPISEEMADKAADFMLRAGWPASYVREMAKDLRKKPRGRPVSKRLIAIRALELQRADPKKWTWSKLTVKLCDCGAPPHGPSCQNSLRREVNFLKKVLRKYEIALPKRSTPL